MRPTQTNEPEDTNLCVLPSKVIHRIQVKHSLLHCEEHESDEPDSSAVVYGKLPFYSAGRWSFSHRFTPCSSK